MPPLKIQGGKTRLVPFLREHLGFESGGQRWVEPFLGAGGVLLNVLPERALVADQNPHIIEFYVGLQEGRFTAEDARQALFDHGHALLSRGEAHYYEVRERFNACPSPLDFLFLSHACFNGLLRFNRQAGFNSPFCRDPGRLTQSLVENITDRVLYAEAAVKARDWTFRCQDWSQTLRRLSPSDFVYADPPYVGRHATYYTKWSEDDATSLAIRLRELPVGWGLSDWAADRHGPNERISLLYPGHLVRTCRHRYTVGASGKSRGGIQEALVLSRYHGGTVSEAGSSSYGPIDRPGDSNAPRCPST